MTDEPQLEKNPPAFPSHEGYTNNYGQLTVRGAHEGMTLRDYFAAKAMQAEMADPEWHIGAGPKWVDEVAQVAYKVADAMLKAREA